MIDDWRNLATALAAAICGYAYATDRYTVATLLALTLLPYRYMADFTWTTIVELAQLKRGKFFRISR